jgi:phosphate-selective porin
LCRYDEFDPDKTISNNNQREYTAGVNYYIKGQALKLILNYVYCQNQAAKDSHRILVGTQIAL